MAAPVWVLSVDLQTKTASFTTGLADAARQARGSFNDISAGAREMGGGVQQGATNVRAAIGLVDNTIRGNHAAAMADLIREFSHTQIVMAALPFAAVAGGIAAVAAIVVEAALKVKEWREEQEKLTQEQTRFGTTAQEALNSLDDKLLEAGKRSDELRNDHLGALRKELELIDHASLTELMKTFGIFEKAADEVFKHLEGHWYSFAGSSAGASHSVDSFKTKYESLLALGKDKEAGDLLAGTLATAKAVLAAQEQIANNQGHRTATGTTGDYSKVLQAEAALKRLNAAGKDGANDVASQRALVEMLEKQGAAQQKIAELKGLDKANATKATGNDASARDAEAARQSITSQAAIAEQIIAGDKAVADARLTIARASTEARLASDLDFAKRDFDVKMAANAQLGNALDKAAKDYQNQLKENNNKAGELTAQYEAQQAELRARASVEQNTRDVANLEAGERAKIAATMEGSQARLSAITAAMAKAQQAAMQDTEFYRSLGTERAALTRQMAAEDAKAQAEAGKEAADNELRTGQLELAAQEQAWDLQASAQRVREAERLEHEKQIADAEFALKLAANLHEQGALDATGKDYENKLKALQDKETQLIREHENQKAQIRDQAAMQQNSRELASYQAFANAMSQSLTSVLMRHQSFASAMAGIGNEVVSGMMQNAIRSAMLEDFGKEREAAHAARLMFLAGMKFPFPANIIAAPLMAAGAFSAVMAFAGGTDAVPGMGKGDVVPAMLTPGEGVVPGGVMDGLRNVAKNGGFDQKPSMVIHPTFSPTVHALDKNGVREVLDTHAKEFHAAFEKTLRKMNR